MTVTRCCSIPLKRCSPSAAMPACHSHVTCAWTHDDSMVCRAVHKQYHSVASHAYKKAIRLEARTPYQGKADGQQGPQQGPLQHSYCLHKPDKARSALYRAELRLLTPLSTVSRSPICVNMTSVCAFGETPRHAIFDRLQIVR